MVNPSIKHFSIRQGTPKKSHRRSNFLQQRQLGPHCRPPISITSVKPSPTETDSLGCDSCIIVKRPKNHDVLIITKQQKCLKSPRCSDVGRHVSQHLLHITV